MTVGHERRHPMACWRRCHLWHPQRSAPWGRRQLPERLLQKKLPRRASRCRPRRALCQTPPPNHPSRCNEPACPAATGGMILNTATQVKIRKRRRKRKNQKVWPLQPPTRRPMRLRNSRRNANRQRSRNTSYRHLYSTGRATTSSCTIYHCGAAAATSGT